MHKLYFLLLCFLPLHLVAQPLLPPPVLILTDTANLRSLDNNNWQLLEDTSGGKWNIEQVSKSPVSNAFHVNNAGTTSLDYPVNTFWIRFRVKNNLPHTTTVALQQKSAYAYFYMIGKDGKLIQKTTGENEVWNKRDGFKMITAVPFVLEAGEEVWMYEKVVFDYRASRPKPIDVGFNLSEKLIANDYVDNDPQLFKILIGSFFTGLLFFAAIFNFFFFLVVRERVYFYYALCLLFGTINEYPSVYFHVFFRDHPLFLNTIGVFFLVCVNYFAIQMERHFLQTFRHYPRWDKLIQYSVFFQFLVALIIHFGASHVALRTDVFLWKVWDWSEGLVLVGILGTFLFYVRKKDKSARQFIIACLPVATVWLANYIINIGSNGPFAIEWNKYYSRIELLCVTLLVVILSWILFDRYNKLRIENAEAALLNERLAKEKEMERSQLIAQQKVVLEEEVAERTAELKHSFEELRAAQKQLIQTEKMASLGELTAGIAHEIQNPLNFVNNFSEVSAELLAELKDGPLATLSLPYKTDADEVVADLTENLHKIKHHGKRADAIVKAMLQHSSTGAGRKELTNINTLAEEYLSVSYSGLISKEKNLHIKLSRDFDESLSVDATGAAQIEVIQQDIGRVLVNIFNNAFYSVIEKKKAKDLEGVNDYEPTVSVTTKRRNGSVQICVQDNGMGISREITDKIFQPFFTTKPTGQGTGLGLYLSYDIIKAHGGELKVETVEGEGAEFLIELPVKDGSNK